MRKSALMIAAAVLVIGLPGAAMAQAKDPNANSKKFVGDMVGQVFVPGQSLAKGPATAEPAKKAKKMKKAKKAAKPKDDKKKA